MKMVAMINLCKFLSLTYASDGLAKLKKKKKRTTTKKNNCSEVIFELPKSKWHLET